VNHELIYLFRHARKNGNPASFKYDYRMDARQKNSSMTVTLNMNDYRATQNVKAELTTVDSTQKLKNSYISTK